MIVELKNVTKTYKNGLKALNNLSYEVREGEIYGLLGPNGSGKTTSINCLLSLISFDSGTITIFDKELKPNDYEMKRQIGLVPQNVAVFYELTVYENINYFCGLYIKDKKLRKQYVEEAIDFVQLNDYRKFLPKKLSGGLLRRLNIACGIVHKPKLIVFDEPTVAVDPQSRNQILDGVLRLNKEGSTIIYTSHYMEEVEQICSYIVILDKGGVIAHGTKEALKEKTAIGEIIGVELNKNQTYDNLEAVLKDMKGLLEHKLVKNVLTLKMEKGSSHITEVIETLKENNIDYGRIYSELPSLNDVFLEITGKELRD